MNKNITVSCDTCKFSLNKNKRNLCRFAAMDCLRKSTLMLYWTETTGYLPKRYQQFAYENWQPMEDNFLKVEDFQL